MEYRVLGRTGVRVSALALGTANFADPTPEDEAKQILERAVDAGINVIDTGDSYGKGAAERIIGRALKSSGLREQVVLTTKVFPPTGPGPNDRGNSRLHIMQACEDSLRRLQTDHIDLYQCHRFDPEVPLEETVQTLGELVQDGRIRAWGTSVWSAKELRQAATVAESLGVAGPASEQPRYNLLCQEPEDETVPLRPPQRYPHHRPAAATPLSGARRQVH